MDSQQTSEPKKPAVIAPITRPERSPFFKITLLIVLLLLLGFGGYYLAKPSTTYKKLETVSLKGPSAKNGGSFAKPVELKAVNGSDNSYATFTEDVNKSQQALQAILIIPNSEPFKAGQLVQFGQNLTNPQTDGYGLVLLPIKDFVGQALPAYNIKLDQFHDQQTPNLKTNAWLATFTAQSKANNPNQAITNGEVLVVAGKQSYYYFMLSSSHARWQDNAKIWQKIVNSLQVDQ
jgi:hypothetical protein